MVNISHTVSNGECINIILFDDSINAKVIINSLIDGGILVSIISSHFLCVDLLSVDWFLVMWESVVRAKAWVHLKHRWVEWHMDIMMWAMEAMVRTVKIMMKSMSIMVRSLFHCHSDLFSLNIWSTMDWMNRLMACLNLTCWNIVNMSRVAHFSIPNLVISHFSINN